MSEEGDGREIPELSFEVKFSSNRPVFHGTYSDVYQGSWRGQIVAIKVIKSVSDTAHTMRRKFNREMMVWGHLNHVNITPLYGYADGNGKEFGTFGALISPWYPNRDSAHYLSARRHSITMKERLELLKGATEGISFLHGHDPVIVHGDIKPGNILVDNNGVAKLCDFGLVQVMAKTEMTTTSPYTGTARYMAPELVVSADEKPNTYSDIWSLGCVGLEFLFSIQAYADRKDNTRGYIFEDLKSGVPPATQPDYLSYEDFPAWDILQDCWDEPEFRPMAYLIKLRLDCLVGPEQEIGLSLDGLSLSSDLTPTASPKPSSMDRRSTALSKPSQSSISPPLSDEAAEYERVRLERLKNIPRKSHTMPTRMPIRVSPDRGTIPPTERNAFTMVNRPNPIECTLCSTWNGTDIIITIRDCSHSICQECLRSRLTADLAMSKWPIVCPACADGRGAQPSVIRREVAEMSGLDEDMMLHFERAELKAGSFIVECPSCRKGTRVYAVDLQNPIVIQCTPGCSAFWCTKCSQIIPEGRGVIHRCETR